MAYDVTEERLKVKGSEQITRDLKVNRDAFINGKAETGSIDDKGDLKVAGEILAGDDVTISGDLYVNGTEYINNAETAQTTDNYLVLRHNQTTPLGTNEYSGVAVHNYASGKTATITTDKDGTWRVADNTETDTNYTNISYYNGTYYTGLTRTAATVTSGMKTAFDEDELDESVYYNNSYYHFNGSNWFPVSLVDNKLTLGSAVTDSTTITALNALTKEDLVYFRTLTITVINPVENQPLLTRAETSDLTDGQALTWDATNQKAVGKTIDTTVTSDSSSLITSGAVKTAIDNEATARNTAITNAVNALDVASVGGDTKYISAISETDGKISATAKDVAQTYSSTGTTAVCGKAIAAAIGTLDVASTGGDGKYISAISETDGKISATATTMDTAPTADSTKAVTSGGVNTAIANEATARNTAITNAINALDVTDTAVAGKYVSAVSETNGKISVTRADIPNTVNNAHSINGSVTCSTAKTVAAKTVTLPGFSLVKGAKLIVNVTIDNDVASALTLNVNGTGAKTIRLNGSVTSSSVHSLTAGTYNCYYDGTYWNMDSGYEAYSARTAPFANSADYTRGNAVSTTDAATAAKVASMRGFTLTSGATFPITFTNANTAASALTLNINSTGAKPIYINNAASSSSNHTLPAGTYLCRYNGTRYYIDTGYAVISARNASYATTADTADYTRGTAYSFTAAGTAAKTANMVGFVLESGTTFPITFTNANSAASALTLNVNGTGAKPIYINGSASSYTNHTLPAGTYMCRYNGNNYYIDRFFAVPNAREANFASLAANASAAHSLSSSARLDLLGADITATNLQPLSDLHPYVSSDRPDQDENYFSCIGSFGISAVIYASTVPNSNAIAGFAVSSKYNATPHYYPLSTMRTYNKLLRLLIL